MKKFYLLLVLLCGVCAFSACSDDDDDDANEMVGKWTVVSDYFLKSDGKKTDEGTYKDGYDVYYFNADGSGKNVYKDTYDGKEHVFEDALNYTYDAGKKILSITMKDDDGKDDVMHFTVSFNGSICTAKTIKADEDGEIYVMTLKKI